MPVCLRLIPRPARESSSDKLAVPRSRWRLRQLRRSVAGDTGRRRRAEPRLVTGSSLSPGGNEAPAAGLPSTWTKLDPSVPAGATESETPPAPAVKARARVHGSGQAPGAANAAQPRRPGPAGPAAAALRLRGTASHVVSPRNRRRDLGLTPTPGRRADSEADGRSDWRHRDFHGGPAAAGAAALTVAAFRDLGTGSRPPGS